MVTEEMVKFFMEAKRVWVENKLSEKLEDLLEERKEMKFDPFDVSSNPFFIIEKEFRDLLISKKVIEEGNESDLKLVAKFLSVMYLPYQLSSLSRILSLFTKKEDLPSGHDHSECDGDCAKCPTGKDILSKMAKGELDESDLKSDFSDSDNNNNPGGIWN